MTEKQRCCKTCEHYHASTDKEGICAALLPVWVTDALPNYHFDGFNIVEDSYGDECHLWNVPTVQSAIKSK